MIQFADLWTARLRILASYHYYGRADFDKLIGSRFKQPFPEVFADSGAYSAFTQGAEIDIDHYANWLERWSHYFTVYANLDVVGDREASMRNQKILEDRGLTPIPVFHTGTDWSVLEQLVEQYEYIGLGRMVPFMGATKKLMPWLIRAFKIAGDKAVFHGFGSTNWTVVKSLPWYSVDSSSWGQGYRYGAVPIFDPRAARFFKARLGSRDDWAKHSRLVRSYGLDPDDFADRERNRTLDVVALSALSYLHAEKWLKDRHGEIKLPSGGDPGPKYYLADSGAHHMNDVIWLHKQEEQ